MHHKSDSYCEMVKRPVSPVKLVKKSCLLSSRALIDEVQLLLLGVSSQPRVGNSASSALATAMSASNAYTPHSFATDMLISIQHKEVAVVTWRHRATEPALSFGIKPQV